MKSEEKRTRNWSNGMASDISPFPHRISLILILLRRKRWSNHPTTVTTEPKWRRVSRNILTNWSNGIAMDIPLYLSINRVSMTFYKEYWCCNAFAKTQKHRNEQIMASSVSESSLCILFDVCFNVSFLFLCCWLFLIIFLDFVVLMRFCA